MKVINLIFVSMILLTQSISAQTENYQIKSHQIFDASDIESIALKITGSSFEIRRTKSKRVFIDIQISANIPSKKIMAILMKKGRYDVISSIDSHYKTMTVEGAKKIGIIFINGKELKEEISYVLYIPNDMHCYSSNGMELALNTYNAP